MSNKIQGMIKKSKKQLIFYGILWLICVIVFIMPISVGIKEATINEKLNFGEFVLISTNHITNISASIKKVFTIDYFTIFVNVLWKFTLVFMLLELFGLFRTAPKGEYEEIEHGSSDWCKNGEQYKILSNKKGIILGEENFLPVDKRGNVNVLVVGRIRFW